MRIFTVDAFTTKPFSGNPAAVCLPESHLSDDIMQKIAAEMRLSETCFVVPRREDGEKSEQVPAEYSIRWFTPTNEVNLCGHATLAAAHVLCNVLNIPVKSHITFVTKESLKLTVRRDEDSKELTMTFPSYPPVEVTDDLALLLLQELLLPIFVKSGRQAEDDIKSVYWSPETKKVFFLLSNEIELESLDISNNDMERWMALELPYPVRGVCITKCGADSNTFDTRYFSPWNGIGEDPVNGSSHTVLGPLWRSLCGGDSRLFCSRICSPRGGEMSVLVAQDNSEVQLKGSAVIFMSGTLHL